MFEVALIIASDGEFVTEIESVFVASAA